MTEVNYTIAQLAEFAQKGEVPSFMFAKYEKAKMLLLAYPASLKKHRHSRHFAGLSFSSAFIASTAALPYAVGMRGSNYLISFVVGIALALFLFWIGFKLLDQFWDRSLNIVRLGELAKFLSEIVNWTEYEPAQIASLTPGDLRKLFEDVMVNGCKIVLIFQEMHANDDPAEWRNVHQCLSKDVKYVYDTLLRFDVVASGGYGRYYNQAKRELYE